MRKLALAVAGTTLVAGGLALAQDFNLPPTFGEVTLTANFNPDPFTVDLIAGGPVNVANANLNPTCVGMIADAPDYRLQYTAGALPLIFRVLAEADTTLVINAPDGVWFCNDDTNGFNPEIIFEAALSGQYDIWVGTYAGAEAPAQLQISEIR